MAEAETRNHIANALTEQRLGQVPARQDVRGEPVEPVEPQERGEEQRGRSPEEIVPRETVPEPIKEPITEPAPEKKYKVKGEELTLKQIVERNLLDSLIITAEQFPALQQKYQERLERYANKDVAPRTETPAARPEPPSQKQIRDTFLPMALKAVELGHLEADFVEAYPDVSSNLMYFRDIVMDATEKLGHVINWIKAEADKRNAITVQSLLNQSIDAVANKTDDEGKPVKVFEFLRKPDTREQFVAWLRRDIDPKVGSLTPDNMEKFALAFISGDLLKITKAAVDKSKETPPRRRAQSDGSSSRPGAPETPKPDSVLDRLTNMRLGPEA